MEDLGIVALFWQRDEQALAEVSQKYTGYCRRIAYNILGDDSDTEESVNDTWLAAWDSIPPHRPAVLSAYLGKLTRRIARHRLEKRTASKRGGGEYTEALEELADCIPAAESTEDAVDAAALAALIDGFVRTLPARERSVFIRRYFAAEPVKEIAARMGMSVGGVKSMLLRTRRKLAAVLEKEGYR